MTDDDLLTNLRLRRISPADPVQVAALLRERDADLERQNADLRRKVQNLEARLAQPQSPTTFMAAMAARNEREYQTWIELQTMVRMVEDQSNIMPSSTAHDWCDNYELWCERGRDEKSRPSKMIECRQQCGPRKRREVRVESFFAACELKAQIEGKHFVRP
ncbi:hypothetical protein KUL72_24845 [Bradyrhizobium arachidis]|uniref:hypothetical protein n=1 Tax=Bradyrhizobium arachidis TaxID=858423 RepID=UPI002162BF99|nr:hypothetical protein [Bradyrhizobium arachidis]UVO34680.1 hypothetical protein KUL72_24845 [Bradyrhizobium arachidis]